MNARARSLHLQGPNPSPVPSGTPRGPRRLEDLFLVGGPPLRPAELARLIGMSSTFIREEIHGGHLKAAAIGHGRKRVFRIPAREALRYIRSLGLV
jgi:hypothetical protein